MAHPQFDPKAMVDFDSLWSRGLFPDVDTCCIDSSDCSEVVRSAKSMYSYYHNSEVCYVHLADVQNNSKVCYVYPDVEVKGSPIWRSEWFQQGWTLQELVAPRRLEFFSADWEFIGDRHQLANDIHYLTGISPSVLNGSTPLHSVDIRTRMSWCAGRKTVGGPDLVYSLFGIL
ncbi:hypothetical protein K435DRAFT_868090 [Dendrothele bispora CBS 962.96]|uniref:Heterokaryon incompatibility domain-containing protein n=1 Tax=Dendrothele bispora (strain CBS 962.96) TaxID=1314807 RepID=A0A4S8LD31_DENBC|nr:hypothetical protein K435DRAFT_868090 [Dendrothele bispora CBS 962.96]